MRSTYGDESSLSDSHGSSPRGEKILVSVRLRPLNEREISKNDISDWECINNTTIISKSSGQMSPTAYSFDRVFGDDCSTRQVYAEGAKQVALSVVNGINASIFAYGQTSSGKTYTMSGITEYTLSDIYNYVNQHETREFVLKFAAIEIYNECVRDLLASENTALRLLDDPERGTVVEKLTEVTLRYWDQLKEILSVCEAQRQVGETSLNEASSRSHQILRLTVESSARKYSTSRNADVLIATVNFVDLAGSERASQTTSVGKRLKEGCHINRSLLTLGTVIRKLSRGRNGHVPYRDSKLTRILQNSLGGNARTAIICTLNPAHSHAEQSKNTLLFASCAKQVTNSAQVNVVMSEKALVKALKKELARVEKELKRLVTMSSGSCDSLSALQEKERMIEKMDKEIRELTQQRDLAHSRLQILQEVDGHPGRSLSWANSSTMSDSSHDLGLWQDYYSSSEVSEIVDRSEIASTTSQRCSDRYDGTIGSNKIEDFEAEEQLLSDDLSPTKFIDKYFGPDPSLGWEKIAHRSNKNKEGISKEVQCVEVEVDKHSILYDQVTSQQSSGHHELRPENDNETSKMDAQDRMNNTSHSLDDISHPKEERSPNSSDIDSISNNSSSDDNLERSKSCGEILLFGSSEVIKGSEDGTQTGFEEETPEKTVEVKNLKVFEKLNHDNKKLEDKAEKFSEDKVDQQQNNLKVFDELDHDNEKIEDREDKTERSIEENVDQEQNNVQVLDKLNHDSKEFEATEDKTETSNEENVDKQHDYKDPIIDRNLECSLHNENSVENLECQKPISDNHVSDVSSSEDEQLECHNHLEDNNATEVESVGCENHTSVVTSSVDKDNCQHKEASENNHVLEMETTSGKLQDLFSNHSQVVDHAQLSSSNWSTDFEKQRQTIIELWKECYVPLVHRTYFFLLFKGEPSDSIYMEVEQRRLSYLKSTFSRSTETSSLKALRREREKLRRQMQRKFSSKERESLYEKWGIALKSKRRRLQLCSRLWIDTKNLEHIKDSAAIVAKLVGLVEPNAPKEIFGLSLPSSSSFRSHSWQGLPSLL